MELNNLVFGNPSQEHLIYLKSENYLDSLFNELSSMPPPANDSEETHNEIIELVRATIELSANEPMLKRFRLYDADFEGYIVKKMVESGILEKPVFDLIVQLHQDIVPLLMKLKYNFNRARPHQVAYYKEINLHPFRSFSADSPSYPSGHCYQAQIYAEVIGNTYPQFYKAMKGLAQDITISRQYLGLHYPSDCQFSLYCADLVLKHPEFRKKYKL